MGPDPRRVAAGSGQPDRIRTRSGGLLLVTGAMVSLFGVVLGVVAPPTVAAPGVGGQLLALLRMALAVVMVVTLLVGPGLVLRTTCWRLRWLPLGFVPVPGIAILGLIGVLVWVLTDGIGARPAAALLLVPLLLVILFLARRSDGPVVDPAERTVLMVAGLALAIAVGKSLWSSGPAGELYAGTISRTLEVGDRSDSRIPFVVSSLVAHGNAPYGDIGSSLFAPWNFSARGPLSGLIAGPLILLTGAVPGEGLADLDLPWSPFDAQGFMVFRLVSIALALTTLLAVYTLARQVANDRAALLAVIVVTGTPFFVHETYFTWPKLSAAAMCLLAAYLVLRRKPLFAGLLVGLGYLLHPLVLFSVPALLLLAVLTGNGSRRHRLVATAVGIAGFLAGLGVVLALWKLVNGSNYSQTGFLGYLVLPPGTIWDWLRDRAASLGNTWIPLRLPLFEAENRAINVFGGSSTWLIHFSFQYWTGVPFGLGIAFFPFLVMSLVRLCRRHPMLMVAVAAVPMLMLAVYSGGANTGLLRDGLHVWVLTLLILWSVEISPLLRAGGPAAQLVRLALVLRLVDMLVMLMLSSVVERTAADPGFEVTDVCAVVLMVVAVMAVGWFTLRISRPGPALGETQRPWWAGLSPTPFDAEIFGLAQLSRLRSAPAAPPGWLRA